MLSPVLFTGVHNDSKVIRGQGKNKILLCESRSCKEFMSQNNSLLSGKNLKSIFSFASAGKKSYESNINF